MGIVKVEKAASEFIQIHKFPIYHDASLSWKAKGILTYLVGHPSGWQTRIDDLVQHASDGVESVKSGLKELQARGYAEKKPVRNSKGQLIDWDWTIYELPQNRSDQPKAGNPSSVEVSQDTPKAENPHSEKCPSNKAFTPKAENPHSVKPNAGKPNAGNPSYINKDSVSKIDNTHTHAVGTFPEQREDEKPCVCVCGSASQQIRSVSETPDTPETLTLLAEATSLNVSTLKNLMQTKKASLNGLYHAFTYIRKHKEKVATHDPTGETFLRKTALHLFDEQGNFTRANGTGHIDIPTLQAWFYQLPPNERMRLLEPALTPDLLTLKKSERWLHPAFQQAVFAAAQSYGNNQNTE